MSAEALLNPFHSTARMSVEVMHAKVKDPVIKILVAKMHVTSSGLHLEDVVNRPEGYVLGRRMADISGELFTANLREMSCNSERPC